MFANISTLALRSRKTRSTQIRTANKRWRAHTLSLENLESRQFLAADAISIDPLPMAMQTVQQSFEKGGEQDRVSLYLNAGDMLMADFDTTGGVLRDAELAIENEQGNVVATNDDARDPATHHSTFDPALIYVAETSGTHTILLSAKSDHGQAAGITEYQLNLRNYTLNKGNAQPMTNDVAEGDTMAWLVGDSLFLSDTAGNGFALKGDWTKTVTVDADGLPSARYTNNGSVTVTVADPQLERTRDTGPAIGDSNEDRVFDQRDVLQVLRAGKYLSGQPATLQEGDWNSDGVFDQHDLVFSLTSGGYQQTPFAAFSFLNSPNNSSPIQNRGLYGEYFQLNTVPSQLSDIDFDQLTPVHTRIDSTIDFPGTIGPFGGLSAPTVSENFAVRWTGQIFIDTPGEYTFVAGSDDGSRVFVDGILVDNNDGLHVFRENSSYSQSVQASSPSNWYRFDGDGTTAIDMAGGLNGSFVNVEVEDDSGVVGGSVRLAQDGDHVALDGPPVSGPWTAEFVLQNFNNTSGVSDHLLEDSRTSLKLDQFPSTGEVGFTRFGLADFRFSPAVSMPPEEFVHLAFVGSPASGVSVYVNGSLAGTNPNYIELPRGTIGRGDVNTSNALIDEVVLYERALPASEILGHANAAISPTGPIPITLSRGFHDVRMEFFERSGNAQARLRWNQPGSGQREVVPSDVLFPNSRGGGLFGEYYELDAPLSGLNEIDFDAQAPVHTRVDDAVEFPNSTTAFGGLSSPALFDQFAARWSGQIYIDTPGEYTFLTSSDDGSRVFVDGALVVDNDGPHVFREARGTVTLAQGLHDLRMEFFENGGSAGAQLQWIRPSSSAVSSVPAQMLIPSSLTNGVYGQYYQLNFSPTSLDDIAFSTLTPTLSRSDATIDVSSPDSADNFAVRWTGYIYVDTPGDYSFIAGSGDGSRVYVNDYLIADNDGRHDFTENTPNAIRLDRGLHSLRMEYFEDADGAGARLSWIRPGSGGAEIVPTDSLFHEVDGGATGQDMGTLEMEGEIVVETVAGVFGDVTGAVGELTSELQFTAGIDPLINFATQEYGLALTLPGTSFGINMGRDLDFLFAPLRDSGIYIWSRTSTGASVTFGGVVASAADTNTVTTIIDPADPFIYTEAGDFRFGASVQGLIPFFPTERDSQFPTADLGISGHLYGRWTDIAIPDLPATLRGEVVLDLQANDPSARIPDLGGDASGLITEGLSGAFGSDVAVGVNGMARVGLPEEYTLGLFSLTAPVAGVTLQYRNVVGGLLGPGEAAFSLSGGSINPLGGTPFEDLFMGGSYQLQFTASGDTPLEFAQNFRIDAAHEQGTGSDGIGIDIPGAGEIRVGGSGHRLDLSISRSSAEITAGMDFLLGTAELQGNLDLSDGGLYMSAELAGNDVTFLSSDVFNNTSSAFIELGLNGTRPDGTPFTGLGTELNLGLEVGFEEDIPVLGNVGFGVGGNLSGRLEAGLLNGQLAYSGNLSGDGQIFVDLPGSEADFEVATAFDVAIADAIDEFVIPLPSIELSGVSVDLPDVTVQFNRNGPGVEVDRLRVTGLDVTQIAETLRDVYEQAADQAAAVLAQAQFVAEEIGEALQSAFGQSEEAVAMILFDLQFGAAEIGNTLQSVYGTSQEITARILNDLEYGAMEVGNALIQTYQTAAADVADLLLDLGYGVSEVAATLRDAASQSAQQVAQILSDLRVGADQIGQALRDIYGEAADQVAEILRDLGLDPREIGDVLSDEFFQFADNTVSILTGIGSDAQEVAEVLRDVYQLGSEAAASVLADVGFVTDQIADSLRSAFEESAQNVASILQDQLGIDVISVASTLRNVFGLNSQQALSALGLGDVNAATQVLRDVFGATTREAAIILVINGGFVAGQVAEGLRDVYQETASEVAALIQTPLGEGIATAAEAVRDAFNLNEVGTLVALGLDQIDVHDAAAVLRDVFLRSSAEVVGILRSVDYLPNQIADGLRDQFAEPARNVAELLLDVGQYGAELVADALRTSFNLSSIEIANLFDNVFNLSDGQIRNALAFAGFAASEIDNAVSGIVDRLESGFCGVFSFIC